MNQTERAKLAATWAAYAAYYRVKLHDEVLQMYAEDLGDLELAPVIEALSAYRKNPKNRQMPMPADIRAIVTPGVDPESAAREIAARITSAIPKFGWCNAQEAKSYIGDVGWSVVERQGGWTFLCQHHGLSIDPSTFQAQTREIAKASLMHDRSSLDQAIGRINSSSLKQLVNGGDE